MIFLLSLVIGSILTAVCVTLNLIHLKLMEALKNNRDFIVYFAGAYSKISNNSLENYTKTRLKTNSWLYLIFYLIMCFSGIFAPLPILATLLLFIKDRHLFPPFWKVLFPKISAARYYPIQPF